MTIFISCLALPEALMAATPLDEDYNQWKEALTSRSATAAEKIVAPPQFRVELIRSARTNEGSWVALAFDPEGRAVIAREDRGLLRCPLQTNDLSQPLEAIHTNLFECRGLLFAHGALFANANNSKALVRLRDTDHDDQFDEIKVLRYTPGGVGHGRNQLALGPDGLIYSIHGDDVRLPTNGVVSSLLPNYSEDRLLPCEWDKHLANAGASMPYGHVIRTDPDGKRWELWAGGLRNPFGLDFNPAGDLFTFDADMEWDVGLSWYHPTRVLHLVAGGDYGWRRGTGVLPVWSPDTLPSAADIGVSSPTAIKFGTRSNWPEPWKSALFVMDWSYGRVLAVHLNAEGPTYRGRVEPFLKGRPLNVTGLEFGPDGALYFVTGGRRTQSGLYRVSWTGTPAKRSTHTAGPSQRRKEPTSQDTLWEQLDDSLHWVRYQARVELERRPIVSWAERALAERRPFAGLTALLALSRAGDEGLKERIVASVLRWQPSDLQPEQQLLALRTLQVCFVRVGYPDASQRQAVLEAWEPAYPAHDARVNQSLCELLVYLGAPGVTTKTLPLIDRAETQEEKFHYIFTLRLATNGWSLEQRQKYFGWLKRARTEFVGANMLPTALNYIRTDAEATLSSDEREQLRETLASLSAPAAPVAKAARPTVKQWSMDDFADVLSRKAPPQNAQRGKQLFTAIGCAQCHRTAGAGGLIGPDLTAIGARFDRRALLESIIEPSRVIAETYQQVSVALKSGAIVDGRIVEDDAKNVVVALNPVDPDQRRRIAKADIARRSVSSISPMPPGLVDSLTRDEILDLVGFLESGAP